MVRLAANDLSFNPDSARSAAQSEKDRGKLVGKVDEAFYLRRGREILNDRNSQLGILNF